MTKTLPDKFVKKMDDKTQTRRREILDAALSESVRVGYRLITAKQVAAEAGCTHGTVFNHFRDMANLRRAVMVYAIDTENAEVVLQGIVSRDHAAMRAPYALKQMALTILNSEH